MSSDKEDVIPADLLESRFTTRCTSRSYAGRGPSLPLAVPHSRCSCAPVTCEVGSAVSNRHKPVRTCCVDVSSLEFIRSLECRLLVGQGSLACERKQP